MTIFDITYPPPLGELVVERLLQQRIDYGWTYPLEGDSERELAKASIRRRVRMRMWLDAMGIDRPKGPHPKPYTYRGTKTPLPPVDWVKAPPEED